MAISSGFFASYQGDRKYGTQEMSSIFDGIIRDGIFMHIGDKMMVKAATGMTVNLGTGKAWFNHTWTKNDSLLPLTIESSELLLARIDRVILDIDSRRETRANSIKVLKGTPSSNPTPPTLTNEEDHYQYSLAQISVPAGITAITQANITNEVGLSNTPFVTGVLETMPIDDLIAQWQAQWTERITNTQNANDAWINNFQITNTAWMNQFKSTADAWYAAAQAEFDAFMASIEEDFTNAINANQAEFDAWFADVQGTLGTDAAGNLLNKINALTEKEFNHYYGCIAKTTTIVPNSTKDGVKQEIREVTDEATIVTFFMDDGNIEISIVPVDGNYNYTKTVTFGTDANDYKTIIETYSKVAKSA